jgi:hypothetical protein
VIQAAVDKFRRLFGQSPEDASEHVNMRSIWRVDIWSSSCDRFHCEMKAVVKEHRTLTSRLVRVDDCLKERFDSACGLSHRQANETLKRLNCYDSEKTLWCIRRCGKTKLLMPFGDPFQSALEHEGRSR